MVAPIIPDPDDLRPRYYAPEPVRPALGRRMLSWLGKLLDQCLAYYAAHTTSATNMGVIGSLIPLLTL
ncbi:EamA family transporter, partial [Aeromonas salmonicida]|nr:EamA family transporter [Aeromonas salmonicida]